MAPHRTAPALALLALLPLSAACGGAGGDGRPNVVLVTLDTTRADYLSCYGYEPGTTPALDELAADGVRFETAVASSSVTPVSHATILTGKYQYEHGLRVLSGGSGFRLPSDQATLARVYKDAGYTTGAIHSAFPVSRYFGFERDFDHFDDLSGKLQRAEGATKTSWAVDELQRRSDETSARVLEWIESAEEPFFLWIHYWDPHDPVMLPPREHWADLEYDPRTGRMLDSERDALYAAEVRYQDLQIGEMLRGLAERGLLDTTLVAVTADHGQGLSDGMARHGWAAHRMVYREQLHVPLLLRGPGLPAGTVVPHQVRTADVAPTLLELSGLAFPDPVQGESLLPLIEGRESGDRVAYADQVNGYDHNAGMVARAPDAAFLFSVSDGRWKLIYRPHMPEASALYDLSQDPFEEHDVKAHHRDVYLRLMADLAERNPWVTAPFPELAEVDPAAAEALGGLGYSGADLESDLDWWWTCPEHPDHRAAERGRHEEGACGRILVPATVWR